MKAVAISIVVVGVSGIIALGVILGGYVFSWLWLWFAVPLGAKPIGVALSIGIVLLVRTAVLDNRNAKESKEPIDAIIEQIVISLLVLGMGYIIHLFV